MTTASPDIINQFPGGQNLSVHYYRNQYDAQLEQNEILPQTDYLSETPFSQTIFVRAESLDNGDCFGIGPYLILTVHPRPEFEVIQEATVCINLPAITLETFNPDNIYTYQWTNSNGTPMSNDSFVEISIGGIYNVIATSTDGNYCQSFPKTVTVTESNVAIIMYDDVTIKDDSNNNTIQINNENGNLGIGNYEFSLDDKFGPYQDESLFEKVTPGIHSIYVKDKNSCGISILEISVIGFPKFFTPNNDGQNDTWKILGVDQNFFPTSLIYVYDRFGKILAKVSPTSEGWDGYYNGIKLPADDYWFSTILIDKDGSQRVRKGHFSMIRR